MNPRRTIEQAGWTVSRGSFSGTADDCIDAWYLDSPDASVLDRRGPGFPTLAKAAEALSEHLDGLDPPARAKAKGMTQPRITFGRLRAATEKTPSQADVYTDGQKTGVIWRVVPHHWTASLWAEVDEDGRPLNEYGVGIYGRTLTEAKESVRRTIQITSEPNALEKALAPFKNLQVLKTLRDAPEEQSP